MLDTTESLGDVVVEHILDGRPMEGITCPDRLECSLRLLDATLDSGLVKNISDWEPEASPVPDATLDSRLTEGITNLEHSALGGIPVQWTHGGDVVSGISRAVSSYFIVDCTIYWMCYG